MPVIADQPLRIGFLGAGVWARMMAERIMGIPGLRIVAVFDENKVAAAALKGLTQCQVFTDYLSFLSEGGLEAVVVATPNDMHSSHVLRALEAGLHVFVEKPMGNSVQECRDMITAADKAGRVLMVGHNTRREPRFRRVRQMITSGALGNIVAGNMIFSSPAGLMQPADSWRMNPERCIALVVSQLGVHLFDTFNYIFGLPVEVQATVRSVALSNGVEDLCSGTLEYEGGTCANFTVCYSTARRRVFEVLGTKGSVYADESNIWYRSIESSSTPEVTTFPDYDTVREEFEEFVRCCVTHTKPETDGLAGLRAVAVMEKVLSANLERKALKIDWNSLETRDTGPPQAQGNGAVPFRET